MRKPLIYVDIIQHREIGPSLFDIKVYLPGKTEEHKDLDCNKLQKVLDDLESQGEVCRTWVRLGGV